MLLVLGYGNTLCRDDGFAFSVIAYLRNAIADMSSVEIICEQQLLPEHAERLSQSSLAIFVDASCSHDRGAIDCIELEQDRDSAFAACQTALPHSLSPSKLLAMAAHIYGSAPPAYLYTVGAVSLELGEGLSPTVEKAVPRVGEMILTRIKSSCKTS